MLELNLTIIGLILSIIFSSLEIALISANKLQIDVWIKQNFKLSQLTKNILDDKPKYLIVTLIGTTLSNILCSSFCTVYLVNNNIVVNLEEVSDVYGPVYKYKLTSYTHNGSNVEYEGSLRFYHQFLNLCFFL